MTRRADYRFERRRKEEARRAKQEAKRRRKIERAQKGIVGPEMDEPQETGAQPGAWEWFSPSRSRTLRSEAGTHPTTDPPDDWILLTDGAEDPGPAS